MSKNRHPAKIGEKSGGHRRIYKACDVGMKREREERGEGGGGGGEEGGISFNGKISSFHRSSTLKKNQ